MVPPYMGVSWTFASAGCRDGTITPLWELSGLDSSFARVAQLVEAAGLNPAVRKHDGGSNPSPGTQSARG